MSSSARRGLNSDCQGRRCPRGACALGQRKEHAGCLPGDSLTVRFGDVIPRVLLEEVMGVGGVNALLWEGFRENGRNRGDDIEYGHSL